ncbi:hypothetical protein EDE08_110223 [Bradyrhizobium sp. R2.2-H]|nr:hypothetical protein EDE10_11056 [Bradyrhizobium sp. Y-H1]TCU69201.1 hypothetical protein EDE08_110223 [Bradyrhizobium sp. R2.2-H]
MPGLSRASTFSVLRGKAWMAGTSPAMTLWKLSVPQPTPFAQRLAASLMRRLILAALASSSADGCWPVAAHRQAQ